MPERGRIGIFNRSHYEEVLVVRVHGKTIVRVMQRLDLKYPAVEGEALKQMKLVRQALREEALREEAPVQR